MNNWALQYSGGSGGYLCLHLLLLSGKFYSAFSNDLSLDQIIQKHWNIPSPDQWKHSEIFPNNQLTLDTMVDSNKICFYCNPFDGDNTLEFPHKKIVIYTDYYSQRLLTYYKKAHWYYLKESDVWDLKYVELRNFLKVWQTHYNNIKDPNILKPQLHPLNYLHSISLLFKTSYFQYHDIPYKTLI